MQEPTADTDVVPAPEEVAAPSSWWTRRWKGQPGRLEVWYATMTDRDTGTGLWVHGETVAPAKPVAGARPLPVTSHGWFALFPAEGEPVWARTGTTEGTPPDGSGHGTFVCDGLELGPQGSAGEAGDLRWELNWSAGGQQGLATFPRWAWEREVLPAAQVVPAPSMEATGWVEHAGNRIEVAGHAQAARIYGHGNAERWAWLHADLGDGDVLELVTAVSTRPGLRRLPPITFMKLRLAGRDGHDALVWPRPRTLSWGLRAHLDLPRWRVRGRAQGLEVGIEVDQPAERCVSIDYTDPDGRTAVCTNTERADVVVELRSQDGSVRRWELEGTAHAEVGLRV